MKYLVWNCKGIDRSEFRSYFSILCNLNKMNLFCLLEIKMGMDKIQKNFFGRFFDEIFCCKLLGRIGYLCLYWNYVTIKVNTIALTSRFFSLLGARFE